MTRHAYDGWSKAIAVAGVLLILSLVLLPIMLKNAHSSSRGKWTSATAEVIATRVSVREAWNTKQGSAVFYGGEYQLRFTAAGELHYVWADARIKNRDRVVVEALMKRRGEKVAIHYDPEDLHRVEVGD